MSYWQLGNAMLSWNTSNCPSPPTSNRDPADALMRLKLNDFFMNECIRPIVGMFAAVKFNQCGRGALFLFSRSPWDELLDCRFKPHRKSDRQVMAVWGSLTTGTDLQQSMQLTELCENFGGQIERIADLAQASCSQDRYPVVVVADPAGTYTPEKLHALLHAPWHPSSQKAGLAQRWLIQTAFVLFHKYDVLLSEGLHHEAITRTATLIMNLDREHGGPTQ